MENFEYLVKNTYYFDDDSCDIILKECSWVYNIVADRLDENTKIAYSNIKYLTNG